MKIMDRCHVRVKLFVAVTASALLTSAIASPVAAQSVSWRTIVGVVDTRNTGTPPVPAVNMVGNILPGGFPWTTLGGHAVVNLANGQLAFEVRGLVLAGGGDIGTVPANFTVMGTIACVVGTSTYTADTALVPLNPQGDAAFFGTVGVPSPCNSSNVVFLVRVPAGRWIANGAVKSSP